jgi:hypothetical protein
VNSHRVTHITVATRIVVHTHTLSSGNGPVQRTAHGPDTVHTSNPPVQIPSRSHPSTVQLLLLSRSYRSRSHWTMFSICSKQREQQDTKTPWMSHLKIIRCPRPPPKNHRNGTSSRFFQTYCSDRFNRENSA